MRLRMLTALTAVAVSWAAASQSYADVGRIPASYQVNPTGGFTYSIPIWLPQGPHGVEPHLALVYDSSIDSNAADNMPAAGTNDPDEIPAGVGWVLEGLSTIARTDKTVAQDGAASEPSYSPTDAYMLDGNRLRLTSSGNYGQDGSTYQTELANFSQATAHVSTAYGPNYWTVQGKNGLTYEYGHTSDSQILVPNGASGEIREWLLDKVSDVNGNSYTITYGTGASGSAGIGVPVSISWTPASSGSTTYNYKVALQYTARQSSEAITEYVDGQQIENNNLIQSITVSYQGTTVRYYQLSYTQSAASKRSLLASLEECSDSSLSHCLGATSFSYNQGALSVGSTGDAIVTGATSILGSYDFNGDGRSDILYNNGGTLYVALANGSGGFDSPVSTGISAGTPYTVGDLLHRGEDGILADSGGSWYYYTWNGSSFAGQSVTSGGAALPVEANAQFAIADLDGDGLPDLVITHVLTGPSGLVQIYARQNTSSGGQASFSTSEEELYTFTNTPSYGSLTGAQVWGRSTSNYGVHTFHFTGDAREGLLMTIELVSGSQTALFELTANGFGAAMTAQELTGGYSGGPVVAMNWNADRCTDLAFNAMINSTVYPQIYVNPCNGSAGTYYGVTHPIIGAITLNGDANADVLVDDGGTLGYYPSIGNGVGALVTTGITSITSSASAIPMSVTGDGLPDLGVVNGGSLTYYQHGQVSSHPDLLSSLTDGGDNTIQPSYISITAGAYNLGTGAQDPESDWIGDLWVTQSLTLPDGIGGTYTETYDYSDARWSRLRGFEGFEEIKSTDSRKGVYSQTSYDQLFPLTGMPTESDVFQSDGTAISKTSYVAKDEVLQPAQYNEQYFLYDQMVTNDSYEVGGSENGQKITETVTNATPDQYGNLTEVDTTVTDDDPDSPFPNLQWTTNTSTQYADDTSTWCLALPTSVSIAKTVPNEPTITRTATYTPDDTNCRENSEVEDAGNSNFDVARVYSYDAFGNVSQLTVTGAGMASRTWKYGWGTTGQFPQTVQDPVAYVDGYEESIGYNYGFGVKSSDVMQTTGGTANAPPTKWFYDSFGRVTQEVMSDGTSQNYSYSACGSSCYNGNHFETVTDTTEGTGGAEISDKSTYLDRFGRALVVRTRLMDGSYAQVEQQYDDMGNVAKQSAPCSASSCTDYWTQTGYDLLNRATSITHPDPGNPSIFDTQQIAYAGRTTTATGPLVGEAKTDVTDVTGAIRETRDSYGYGQNFSRDADGNILSVTNSSGGSSILSYTYDHGGEGDYVATRADQTLGDWAYTPDALGEVRSYTDAKLQVFNLYYDGLSRLIERDDGVPTSGSPETVTTWIWGHTPSAHDVNQLDQAQTINADGTYTEVDSYDTDGRPSDKAITVPGDTTYHYDLAYDPTTGLLSALQYPVSGASYRLTLAECYQYGQLTKVANTNCSGSPYWTANQVNPMGEITEDTLGNGVVTQRQFSPVTGWLASSISGSGSTPSGVQNRSYLYDALGDVTQRQDNNAGLTESFWYDSDNRLWKSTLQSGNTTTTNLQVWYNSDGSISRKIESGGTDAPNSYAVTKWLSYNYPQTITATVPTAAGNQSDSATLDYGPARKRWRMVYTEGSASETTEYIGELMEKVTSSTGSTQYRYYIHGADGLAAIQSVDGTGSVATDYALTDQENSISTLLASTGSVAANESFTAFGVRREASTWSGSLSSTQGGLTEASIMDGITRQGFTGQTALGLMGLNHMNGRVEDAVSGTFLSPDPEIQDLMNPQDFNRYVYVADNPVSYTDPTGFDLEEQDLEADYWDTIYQAAPTDHDPMDEPNYGVQDVYNDIQLSGWKSYDDGSDSSASDGGDDESNGWNDAPGAGNQLQTDSCSTPGVYVCQQQGSGVNAPPPGLIGLDGSYSPAAISGTFTCGSYQCSYQMGPFSISSDGGISTGAWISFSASGGLDDGQWVQTWSDSTGGSDRDCRTDPMECPFYPPYASGGQWFIDDPARPQNWGSVTWVGQTSYVLPDAAGAAFTIQWGYSMSNGALSYIPPALAAPWPTQQLQISAAYLWWRP